VVLALLDEPVTSVDNRPRRALSVVPLQSPESSSERMKEKQMNRVIMLVVVMAAGREALSAQVVDRKALTLEGAKKVIAVAEAEATGNSVVGR
jgi:hypothetical protein